MKPKAARSRQAATCASALLPTPLQRRMISRQHTTTALEKIEDYSRTAMLQKMPEPVDNATVLNTSADPNHIQALYLWEEGNVPAKTQFTAAMTG